MQDGGGRAVDIRPADLAAAAIWPTQGSSLRSTPGNLRVRMSAMFSIGSSFTALALFVVFAAIIAYALYWVLRAAIRDGMRDSQKPPRSRDATDLSAP